MVSSNPAGGSAAPPLAATRPGPAAPIRWIQALWVTSEPVALVLGMFLYFLLLGSIAVVVVTGQIPWFALIPAGVMLAIARIRRTEARWQRERSAEPDPRADT
jgi:hypothetical protein